MTRRRRFLFVVGYGANTGNNASLDVAVSHVRRNSPDAMVRLLCWNPEAALRDADVDEVHATYQSQKSSLIGKVGTKISELLGYSLLVARSDVVVYPGTGALEGEMGYRRFAEPFVMAAIAVACRILRRPFLVIGMGVSKPPPGPRRLSGWAAMQLAHRLSFRDEVSSRWARAWGLRRRDAVVGADLVLALDAPWVPPPAQRRVALGVMIAHGGDTGTDEANVALWTAVARGLVDHGCRVELFLGNTVDVDVATRVAARVGSDRVTVNKAATVPDLVRAMQGSDVVVAARYHNLVCGILAGRPTMALSYAEKSLDLVTRAGSGPGHLLTDVDAPTVVREVESMMTGSAAGRAVMLAHRQDLRLAATRLLGAIDESV